MYGFSLLAANFIAGTVSEKHIVVVASRILALICPVKSRQPLRLGVTRRGLQQLQGWDTVNAGAFAAHSPGHPRDRRKRILWGVEAPEQGRTAIALLTAGRCTGAKSARVGPFGAHCRLRAAAAPGRGGAGPPTPAESPLARPRPTETQPVLRCHRRAPV